MTREYDDFVVEVTKKLGGLTSAQYVKAHPGEHLWATYGVECCAFCGLCRVRDQSKQKPCRGIVRISLRDTP